MKISLLKLSIMNKIIISFVVIFLVAFIIYLSISFIVNDKVNLKSSADNLKNNAIQLLNKDAQKAKELLIESNIKYKEINDTNGKIDTESLIYLIDHR